MYDPMAESELSKYSVLKLLIWVSHAAITATLLYSVDYPFVDFSTSLSVCVYVCVCRKCLHVCIHLR